MAKIVPSDIVRYIDKVIINAADIQEKCETFYLEHTDAEFLSSLLDLVDRIDEALLQLNTDDYICFISSKASIKSKLEEWQSRGATRPLYVTRGFGKENPVIWIRRLLEKCPDSIAAPDVSGLEFIEDNKYREMLRLDLTSVEFLLNHNEWKATMVIAGSAIETILCEQISNIEETDKNKFEDAKKAVRSRGDISIFPNDITRWNLSQYIYIAHELNLISEDTKKQALLGKDFRNLIHPGLAIRKKVSCDRGTAHGVLAALDRIISDIKGS